MKVGLSEKLRPETLRPGRNTHLQTPDYGLRSTNYCLPTITRAVKHRQAVHVQTGMGKDIAVRYYDTASFEGLVASTTCYSRHHFPRHFHDHYTIQLIETGINEGFTSSNKYSISPGGVLVINPGDLHAGNSRDDEPLIFHTLRIEAEFLKGFCKQNELIVNEDAIFDIRPIYNPVVESAFHQLIAQLKNGRIMECETCLHQLILTLLRENSSAECPQAYTNSPVESACDYIQENYRKEITLHELADVCHLSPYHFLRVFKRKYGLTPFQYLRNVRIERAKTILSGQSIAKTALQVGFYDHSHFLRYYKQIEGVSPTQSKPYH